MEDLEHLTVKQLRAHAARKGVKIRGSPRKADLIKMLVTPKQQSPINLVGNTRKPPIRHVAGFNEESFRILQSSLRTADEKSYRLILMTLGMIMEAYDDDAGIRTIKYSKIRDLSNAIRPIRQLFEV